MEEQHIPSRSDRHKKKKKGFFLTQDNMLEITDEPEPEDHNESKEIQDVQESLEDREEREALAAWDLLKSGAEPEKIENQETADTAYSVNNHWQQEVTPPPVPKKRKKRRNLNPAAGFLLLFFMLISGAWCGYAAMNAILPDNPEYAGMDQEMLKNVNLLLLGCDEREGDSAARADVIMVATIRSEDKQVAIFSIPRDTRVDIQGHGKDKINHAMAYGGIPLVESSVEALLNIKIDHTVKVNFDGFINVIDALGGINIEVPCRMYKPLEDINLLPGYQTLDGSEALAFVRWRGDGTGDYGRIERQQQFLSAVTEKVKGMSLKQALDVASAVMDSIETDMSVRQMTSYGMNVLSGGTENIKTYSFIGKELWLNGVNYVEPDAAAIADIVDKMQHGEPEPEPPADGQAEPGTTQQ